MFEADLIGGPEDGKTYAFPGPLPPYIYFSFLPEPVALLSGPVDNMLPIFETPKLVYRHILHNLYWYQGIIE